MNRNELDDKLFIAFEELYNKFHLQFDCHTLSGSFLTMAVLLILKNFPDGQAGKEHIGLCLKSAVETYIKDLNESLE